MTSLYRPGLALAYGAAVIFGFLASEPAYVLAFAVLFFLGHLSCRPYDLPRGLEWLGNTGFALLLQRLLFHTAQAALLTGTGILAAGLLGYPLRNIEIPGERLPAIAPWTETAILLPATLGLALLGLLVARLGRHPRDLYGSNRGLWGLGEKFDRNAVWKVHQIDWTYSPEARAAPLRQRASMVAVRPFLLHQRERRLSGDAIGGILGHLRDGHHALRLAHVLDAAAGRGSENAASALTVLLDGRHGAAIRAHRAWPP